MTTLYQIHSGEAPAKLVVNSQLYWSKHQWPTSMEERPERTRQADCQTSSMSELPKQTRYKQGYPFFPQVLLSLPPWLSLWSLISPKCCFFWAVIVSSKLKSLIRKATGCKRSLKKKEKENRKVYYTQLLFYSIFLTLCDRSGGWNVWWWGWEEREESRKKPHRGAVKLSTPGTTRLWSKAAWFMVYGLPHWGETVQFPSEDTADVFANGHASSCSVTVRTKNIPTISFKWKFSEMCFCVRPG